MRAWALAAVVLAQLWSPAAQAQMEEKDYQSYLAATLREAQAMSGRPRVVSDIIAALKSLKFDEAVALCTKILESADDPDETPQWNSWIRSLAHLYRGTAIWESRADWARASVDIKAAAELGNVEATRFLLDAFKAAQSDKSVLGGYQPTVAERLKYTRVAADLDMNDAIQALAKSGDEIPADERLYWMARLFSGRTNLDRQLLLQFIRRGDDGALEGVLSKRALVGGPYPPMGNLPGRDVIATLSAENTLHYTIALSFGARGKRGPDDRALEQRSPTVTENFLFVATTHGRGGLADLHLLVPGPARERGRNIHQLPREDVAAGMRAGDMLYVTCGPLSHTAHVFSVDRAKDELLLVDGLSEFWKPSHNSCVTSMAFRRYKYGFYVVALKLSEVVPILDAVGTFRSAELIGLRGDIGMVDMLGSAPRAAACVDDNAGGTGASRKRWEAWIETDFMRGFNLHRAQTLTTPLATGVYYKIGKPEYFGNVGVMISVDPDHCIRSVSLTIRRPMIEESKLGIDANMIVSAFLADSLNSSGAKAMSPAVERIKMAKDPREKDAALESSRISQMKPELRRVVRKEDAKYEEIFAGEHLRVENLEAASGASLLRFSVW